MRAFAIVAAIISALILIDAALHHQARIDTRRSVTVGCKSDSVQVDLTCAEGR